MQWTIHWSGFGRPLFPVEALGNWICSILQPTAGHCGIYSPTAGQGGISCHRLRFMERYPGCCRKHANEMHEKTNHQQDQATVMLARCKTYYPTSPTAGSQTSRATANFVGSETPQEMWPQPPTRQESLCKGCTSRYRINYTSPLQV